MAKISTVQIASPVNDLPDAEPESSLDYIKRLPEPMQEHALRLLAQLHTNLDVEKLLQDFSREVRDAIPHTTLGIDCPDCYLPSNNGAPLRNRLRLIVEGEYLCDLTVFGPYKLTTAELWQLELWLQVLAYPLRNAIQLHKMRTQVFRDPLTGVQNRIAMDQAMSREVASALRHHNELSMLIIDIDWFKSINDRFGHSTGDVALRHTADMIRSGLRDSDQLFRYGGEEFIVLLAHTDIHGAVQLAERIRRKLDERAHLVGDIRIPITISIGVATLEMDDNVDSLFEKADHALYRAKDSGRNKVCHHHSRQTISLAPPVSVAVPLSKVR